MQHFYSRNILLHLEHKSKQENKDLYITGKFTLIVTPILQISLLIKRTITIFTETEETLVKNKFYIKEISQRQKKEIIIKNIPFCYYYLKHRERCIMECEDFAEPNS